MRRLLATMHCDVRLQVRNGFYYAVVLVLACWGLLMWQLPAFDWRLFLPALVLGNLIMTAFYFIGGLVLLEKSDGTLEAQVVTPLRVGEYLASKVATLTGLSLIENLAFAAIFQGFGFNPLPLTAGVVLASILFALIGFVTVARYEAINEYLLPSVLYTVVLGIPFLHYFDFWTHPVMYVHPILATMILMKAAFLPVEPWLLVYGVIYPLVWVIPAFVWSRRAFDRYIVARRGAR